MSYLSDERGMAPVLIGALAALLVTVLGIAVYSANKPHQKNEQAKTTLASPVSSPVSSVSPAADNYAGWHVYKSTSDGLTFKYPADWRTVASYASQVDIAPSQGDASFRVEFRALSNPSTQFDKSGCTYTREVETVNIPNLGAKKLIAYGSSGVVSSLGLTDDPYNIIGQEAGCGAVFASKAGAGKFDDISAWYGNGGEGAKPFSYDQFIQKPEVQTAERIFRSVTY